MAQHVEGMLRLQKMGSVTFDYGNNIRTFRLSTRREECLRFSGIRAGIYSSAVLRRARAVSLGGAFGRSLGHSVTDDLVLELFPENRILRRWIDLARKRIKFQGLPARICWLGYGERAQVWLGDQRSGQERERSKLPS